MFSVWEKEGWEDPVIEERYGEAARTTVILSFNKKTTTKLKSYVLHGKLRARCYDNRLEITSPGKLPMGQTMERMKEGYSKIRNEALAHAFAYMNLIEHWGSGIPRIIDKVKAAGLREPEFIGGEVDLRINIYRGQVATNNAMINASKVPDTTDKMPDCANKVPDIAEKCRIMSKNNKFIDMYRKMALLLLLRR